MQTDNRPLTNYENLLMRGGRFELYGTDEEKDESAKMIVRYAVTELLEWTPKEAQEHMTRDLMKRLKLDIVASYILCPEDLNKDQDLDYLIAICFHLPYDFRRQLMRQYTRILNGDATKFTKECFRGIQGREKIAYLLQHFIAHNVVARNREELYALFADSASMNTRLRNAGIYTAYHNIYPTPLEFLHYSLPRSEQDEFLFGYYRFTTAYGACTRDVHHVKKKVKTEPEPKKAEPPKKVSSTKKKVVHE